MKIGSGARTAAHPGGSRAGRRAGARSGAGTEHAAARARRWASAGPRGVRAGAARGAERACGPAWARVRTFGESKEEEGAVEEHEAPDELAQRELVLLGHVAHGAVDRALRPAERQVEAQDVGHHRRVHRPQVEEDAHRREAQVEQLEELLEDHVPRPCAEALPDGQQVRFNVGRVIGPHLQPVLRLVREEALLRRAELVLREDGEGEAREQRSVRSKHREVARVELRRRETQASARAVEPSARRC